MSKADKMYKDSPKIEKDEEGKLKVSKKSDAKEAVDGEEAAGEPGMEGMKHEVRHAAERRALHHKHMKEHMELHHKHEMEHAAHKGDKKEMHTRHEKEHKEMHGRHEKEMEAMHTKHEQETSKGEK